MQAVILVGGEGTRLRPLTLTTPKPALTLVDRPFLQYMIDWLAGYGVDEAVLACGFKADRLREVLGEGDGDVRLRYVTEDEPLGTAGAIRFAADALGDELDERFLALNGDVLTDLDVGSLIAQHERTGARATLGLYPVEDVTGYGLVRRSEQGEITEFLEKPDPEDVDTDEINAGIYVLDRSVLELVPPGKNVSIERDVFPRLVENGLYGSRLEGYWMDIGTPERFLAATWDILEGRVRTAAKRPDAEVSVAGGARLGERVLLGTGSAVQGGASVEETVTGEDVRIGENASVRASLIGAGATIGDGAELDGAIVGEGTDIPAGTRHPLGARIPDES